MKTSRTRLFVAVTALAAVVAGLAGCDLLRRPSRIRDIRNVVLISIDTCRADRLGCYGYKRPTTPNIDAVAREGVKFEEALSPVPITTPAHSSMLTGTYPPTHGVRLNNGQRLADANVTLAETLREAGYQTAAFIGGFPLDAQFGLNQGFDTYDCEFTKKSETSSSHSERSAEEVSLPALAWLDQHHAKPFFLFLHYYDAHLSYKPPEPYATEYAGDPYAGEIAYVDHWIGRIVDKLRAVNAYDDTLLIITADHGESLGDHGERAHCIFIYQSTQRVPLVVRAPHGSKGGRFEDRVSLVDLVPTVLDLVGLKTPERVEGTSLRFALEGRPASATPRALYVESLEAAQFQCSALNGIVQGSWKYIRAPRQELYDLAGDPAETNNVVAKEARVAERLRDRLETMLQEMESSAAPAEDLAADPDAVKRLQSLGYVGSGAVPASSAFNPSLEDPKDFMKTFERLEDANALFNSDRAKEAETLLLAIVAERPNLVAAHEQLAQIARRERRASDVVHHEETIVTVLTDSVAASNQDPALIKSLATAHYNLAFALRDAGRDGEAIGHYEQAVRLAPDFVDARNSLGLALARAGRYAEAMAQYEEALRVQPDRAQVHNNFGNALFKTGRRAEGIAHYEQALRIDPNAMSALVNLALIRAADPDPRLRNGAEAVALAQRACAISGPSSLGCLDTLAAAYAEAQRFDEAVKSAEQAVALARGTRQDALADTIETRLRLYRDHRPYRAETISQAPASK